MGKANPEKVNLEWDKFNQWILDNPTQFASIGWLYKNHNLAKK